MNLNFNHTHPKNQAFTLVELLVVISIISLISSVVLSTLNNAREKARMARALQFESSLYKAVGGSVGGYYTFDECSGTVANDVSGNGNNGTLASGATFVTDTPTGKGCAVNFDGSSNGRVNIPVSKPDFDAITNIESEGLTMAGWFKASGLPIGPNNAYFLARQGIHHGFYMNKSNGIVSATIWTGLASPTNINVPSGNFNLNDNKWHHLTLSLNNSDKIATIYVDGVEVGKNTYTALRDFDPPTSHPFMIGGHGDFTFYGKADSVAIFGLPYR